MSNSRIILVICLGVINLLAYAHEQDNIIGRSYKSFETSAYCKYRGFHPTNYLTDNNWDILCAFITPGTTERLDTLDIPFNKSQLRLLEVGGLLSSDNGVYSTVMPIFGYNETRAIRRQSKEFADSIFPVIGPEIKQLISDFDKAGYGKQTYSLIFSYLLDNYIWGDASYSNSLALNVQITYIRKLIADPNVSITSIKKKGYILSVDIR